MSLVASLQTLLGTLVSSRCFPIVAPQGTALPYITFQVISGSPFMVTQPDSKRRVIQIDVIGAGYSSAKTVTASARAALLASSLASVQEMEFDDFDEEAQSYRVVMQYEFWAVT